MPAQGNRADGASYRQRPDGKADARSGRAGRAGARDAGRGHGGCACGRVAQRHAGFRDGTATRLGRVCGAAGMTKGQYVAVVLVAYIVALALLP